MNDSKKVGQLIQEDLPAARKIQEELAIRLSLNLLAANEFLRYR